MSNRTSRNRFSTSGRSLVRSVYLEEPLLTFANGNVHPDPKIGISAFGPSSLNDLGKHPPAIHVGLIGSSQTLDLARRWLEQSVAGVPGTEVDLDFPGCSKDVGFFTDLVFDKNWIEEITRNDTKRVRDGATRKKEIFLNVLDLLEEKLRLLAGRDQPPSLVILALPDELVATCKTVRYSVKRRQLTRNLRSALKARAMKYGMPTQILLEDTMDQQRDPDLPSKKAWNFLTALYFKAGGVPWSPHELPGGTCYIGLSFFRPYDDAPVVHTSIVQAFDETGESLILRGPDFQWDPFVERRSPHLDSEAACKLVSMVLERYEREMKRRPRRIVIHKTSRFEQAERVGFEEALRKAGSYDFVSMRPTSEVRLLRAGKFPALRGTCFTVGDIDYLYTTGYIDCLKMFPAMHVPSPLQITDHIGSDTNREVLLQEILALGKMNWNSARFGGLWPVTLSFSRAVAEIIRELNEEPMRPQFKFYR